MNRVPSRFSGGSAYFRLPDSETLDTEGYFKCLNLIKPLFARPDFRDSTPGFYINYIKDPNTPAPKGSLRLSVFSVDGERTRKSIENFVGENSGIKLFHNDVSTELPPEKEKSPEELEPWNCFDATTQIVLDLFNVSGFNWNEFQDLVKSYRFNLLPQGIPAKEVFGSIFETYSKFYKQIKEVALDNEFWEALMSHYPAQSLLPMHMLVNMVLTYDDPRYYLLNANIFKTR